jgi:ribosomal protein L7/L12
VYLLYWEAVAWAPGAIWHRFGWPYSAGYVLLLLVLTGVIYVWRARRRGLTVREAIAADRAERRRKAAVRRRAREDAAALPWLKDMRLSPVDHAGVLITPAPDAPAGLRHGYDVVLDSAGDERLMLLARVRKLTRLSAAEAMDLIHAVPVTVLRVPDLPMADAAKSVLESAGATVSITDAT